MNPPESPLYLTHLLRHTQGNLYELSKSYRDAGHAVDEFKNEVMDNLPVAMVLWDIWPQLNTIQAKLREKTEKFLRNHEQSNLISKISAEQRNIYRLFRAEILVCLGDFHESNRIINFQN